MFETILKSLATSSHVGLGGVPASARGLAITSLARASGKPVVVIVNNDREMEAAEISCRFFNPDISILQLPAWDCLPYDRVSPRADIAATRLATLSGLAAEEYAREFILITTVGAVMQKFPPKSALREHTQTIRTGESISRDALVRRIEQAGYQRTGKVMEAGEYAVRGNLLDIFVPGNEDAFRLDFFGDEVESIRCFDPLSQVSNAKREAITLFAVHEAALNEETITSFRTQYRELFGAVTKDDPLYESISNGQRYAGMEHWLPLFYKQLDTLADYIPGSIWCWDVQTQTTYQERTEVLAEYYQARVDAQKHKDGVVYNPLKPEALYLLPASWEAHQQRNKHITLSNFDLSTQPAFNLGYKPSPTYGHLRHQSHEQLFGSLKKLQENTAILFACNSAGSMDRMQAMLKENGIECEANDSWNRAKRLAKNEAALCVWPIEHGFVSPDFTVLSEEDVLGERIIRTQKKRRKSEAFMQEAASFQTGELLVHKEHGIGKFAGLITVEVNGNRHDCLKMLYDGDDKLFLPVENIDLLSRYGDADENAKLDKLGGVAWQKRKAMLKERIKLAAEELLKVAAARATRPAPQLAPATGLFSEFCARFPHSETEDQQRSIDETLEDLGKGTPMDRLVCGDVGFGKTEVAMRAAFATVTAETKMQVAIVCPTTLLARQHFKTFSARFEGFPITIKQLSRFVTAAEAAKTRDGLKNGGVDIIIGTHALLAKNIEFKNLGLLIVDEEQHFGVAQKEKLKKLKSDVHVLTLSATPIPRTLQMSLAGVRELSLITTPPVDRLAVRSFVMPYDPVVLREAILREYHRGGKTFYVTPRITYMADLKVKLQQLVPEVRIAAAHGQMPAQELDQIMNDFYDGKYDVLLSTAIVESGIDIPTANTMIIDHSEMFGLAQLYQLRGRVGRSKIRAYAYFTLPHQKTLTPQALRRLEVMQTLDTLGAGFTLASHDMDIRGYGNLLGDEQSGHIKEVGVELYQSMLEEAVQNARHQQKGEAITESAEDWSPQINLGTSVLIPEAYVEDLNLRLGLYRRLASLKSEEEVQSFGAELIDRFGPLPSEVEHLLEVLKIKQLCRLAGVERVDAGPKGAVLSFRHNKFARPEALLDYISKHAKRFKLRPDQKLVLMQEWRNAGEQMRSINQSIEAIAKLAA